GDQSAEETSVQDGAAPVSELHDECESGSDEPSRQADHQDPQERPKGQGGGFRAADGDQEGGQRAAEDRESVAVQVKDEAVPLESEQARPNAPSIDSVRGVAARTLERADGGDVSCFMMRFLPILTLFCACSTAEPSLQ